MLYSRFLNFSILRSANHSSHRLEQQILTKMNWAYA
jgi:hypothetical protein